MISAIRRKRRGFTLVELLVVLIILGVLIAIAVPVYTQSMTNARQTTCEANMRIIKGAVSQFHAQTGAFPADIAALVPNYIEAPPVCPGTPVGTYSFNTATGAIVVNCTTHGNL